MFNRREKNLRKLFFSTWYFMNCPQVALTLGKGKDKEKGQLCTTCMQRLSSGHFWPTRLQLCQEAASSSHLIWRVKKKTNLPKKHFKQQEENEVMRSGAHIRSTWSVASCHCWIFWGLWFSGHQRPGTWSGLHVSHYSAESRTSVQQAVISKLRLTEEQRAELELNDR